MRQYEIERERAGDLLAERRSKVYADIPRIKKIDEELSAAGIGLVKLLAAGGNDCEKNVSELKSNSKKLSEEKARLMESNGVPENYFSDIFLCPECKDTGHINSGHETVRCRCLKQRLINVCYNLPNRKNLLETENFDTFTMKYYSDVLNESEGLSPKENMKTIHKTALQFVKDFGVKFQNLLLYGDAGLGKTFLCNCIARALLEKERTVLYVTAPKIFKAVEDYRFNRDEMEEPDETIDMLYETELLILDDLGSEFATVVTGAALFDIINERLIMQKPTVISTNLPPAELHEQYSERVVSRIIGYYKVMKFFGDDIRVKKKLTGAR